jgi:hypothetical protein
MPQKKEQKERVARLLETLERDDILIISSSKIRLTLRLATCLIFLTISTMLIASPLLSGSSPAAAPPLIVGGIISVIISGTTAAATHRQLSQGIRLTLTSEEVRLENKDGDVIEKARWRDIDQFTPILSQSPLQIIKTVSYHLTDTGRERRQEFLDTAPTARKQYFLLSSPWTRNAGSVIYPSGFTISNSNIFDLLERAHWRYRSKRVRSH